jgi:hypothetical protein
MVSFMALCGGLYGQTYIGAFAGLNSSKLVGDQPKITTYSGLMGANFGLSLDVPIAKNMSIGIQPSYSQEGAGLAFNYENDSLEREPDKVRLNYFSVPLIYKVNSTNKRFYALSGIETAFLLEEYIQSPEDTEELESDISQLNVAIHFGAGYTIPIKKSRLFLEIRYTQGILNLTDEIGKEGYIPRVKTSGLKFFVGYQIPVSKSKN